LRTTRPAWQSRPSPLLLTLTLAIAASGLLLPYLPAAELIGFRPLPLGLLLAMILTVLGYLAASEIAKVGLSRGTFRRRWSS
jgi:Mg2+-importing ATPase